MNIGSLELSDENKLVNDTELMALDLSKDSFNLLMNIYQMALDDVYSKLTKLKDAINHIYGYNAVNNITKRIKTPESIAKKLKKKNLDINLKNIIDNIDDVAGLRIACPIKSDIKTIVEVIGEIPDVYVLEKKDYISNPKRSGYSGYHLIIETPVKLEEQNVRIKVEIQIRTMAMDFWATNEHRIRYKSDKKLSKLDSKKLTMYAKIINVIDDKIMEIYNKQELV